MASREEVIGLYQSVLGRSPYETELAPGGYVDKWAGSGLSVSQLKSKFMSSDEYRSRQGGVGGGSTSGDQGFGSMADFVKDYEAKYQALLDKQKAEQEGKFGEYKSAIAGQEKLGSAYDRLSGEMGIPGLKEESEVFKGEMYKIRDLIDRLEEDIYSRTKGGFVTEAQARSMLAKEGSSLENQLGRLGTAYEPIREQMMSAEQEVSKRLSFLTAEQQKELRPLEMEISMISDRFSREITGFTESKQVELTGLLDKIQRQRELDDREWELAQQLAAEEREFARQKELIAIQQRNSAANSGLISKAIADKINANSQAVTSTGSSSGGFNIKSYLDQLGGTVDYSNGVNFKDPITGGTYTREQVIDTLVDDFGMDRKSAMDTVYGGFKSYGERGISGYTSPTSWFGM